MSNGADTGTDSDADTGADGADAGAASGGDTGDAEQMVVVAGHIVVDAADRERYLETCVDVVEQARRAVGCLDFAISADLVDPARVNIYERWVSQAAVEAFRASGTDDAGTDDSEGEAAGADAAEADAAAQTAMMRSAAVSEYDVAGVRVLSG